MVEKLNHRIALPADMLDCDDCNGAGITKQPSIRKQPHRHRDEEFDWLTPELEETTYFVYTNNNRLPFKAGD